MVASGWPFQRAVEPEPKLEPWTVRVNAGLPGTAEEGLREVMDGMALMVNGRAFEEAPSEEVTVTEAAPALARREAGIWAVN